MQTQLVRETTFIPYLSFLYFASTVAFAFSNCPIFLDVDSNVDVGTDDSEEGMLATTHHRMHASSRKMIHRLALTSRF
jgi:hypothetical protein